MSTVTDSPKTPTTKGAGPRLSDRAKAEQKLGWKATVHAPELARIMVDADRAALECAGSPWIDTVAEHIWTAGHAA